MNGDIQYLRRSEIDAAAWDACVKLAGNGNVYATSVYLDAMATNWDALVYKNYEAVMPLPWRKKWGIRYLYQPAFTAQLGLFGNSLTAARLHQFLSAIPKHFRYWDIALNSANVYPIAGYPFGQRSNYVLNLNKPYEELRKGYRENIRRNIKKAAQYGAAVVKEVAFEKIVSISKEGVAAVADYDYSRLHKVYSQLQQNGAAKTYGIVAKDGSLLASAAFVFSHNTAYYILVGNTANGKTLGASHALIDTFIQDHAGLPLVLDFEGSDLQKLAFFYSSFGAVNEPYPALTLNRLPSVVRWLK